MNAYTMISSCKEEEGSEDKDSSGVPKGVVLIPAAVIEEGRTGEQNQINNEEGDIIENASTVSRKSLLVQTKLDVRREYPVQNKFLRSARYFNRLDCKVYRKKRQKFKKKWKPCYICADWGHNGRFCSQINTCFVCSKKESKNDEEEDRTSMFCLKCGSTGHGMFSCTNDYDPEDLKGIQCYICMDFGHLCCTENSTEGPSEASCYNCGQSGHHGFECTKMNAVANNLQPVSMCFKCRKRVHSLQAGEMDDKATLAETTMAGKDVLHNFVKGKSRPTQLGELDNKLTSTETTTFEKDAVPDKSIKGESRTSRRRERKRKRKPVMPTSNVIQSLPTIRKPVMPASNVNYVIQNLPTMSMIGYTIPRYGQNYGNPRSSGWLSPPEAAARNFVNSPALNQSTYGKPGLNVWLSPPAAAARNCLGNSPAVNQSSFQPGVHFFHHNTNYREETHVPPNPFRPCSFLPHEIFHQGTQIPGPPQNRVQLPHQNFSHLMGTHVPRSTFDSRMPISQQPELPHLAPNHRISALLPHQQLQHQLSSHQTWMAPPGWKPYP